MTGVQTCALPISGGALSAGTIADKKVGSNKPVTVTGLSLGGTDAGNYLIDPTLSGIVVNVTPRPLTVAANSAVRYADMVNATLTFDSSVESRPDNVRPAGRERSDVPRETQRTPLVVVPFHWRASCPSWPSTHPAAPDAGGSAA